MYEYLLKFNLNVHEKIYTEKHGYREHTYNEYTLTVKWCFFPVTLFHVVIWTDITNYTYNEVKLSAPGTLL